MRFSQFTSRTFQFVMALLLFFTTTTGFAEKTSREIIDPSGPLARRAVLMVQKDSEYEKPLPPDSLRMEGSGVIISPCHILTNYHVAFGSHLNKTTNKISLVKNRIKGHTVIFVFDIDQNIGKFTKVSSANVVAFANYMPPRPGNVVDRGTLGDLVLLRMEKCLDANVFPRLDFSIAESMGTTPNGTLMTVSAGPLKGKHAVFAQQGCESEVFTPIDGLFFSNCRALPGMSGSAVYEMGADQRWHITGLTTAQGNSVGAEEGSHIAINARVIRAFLQRVSESELAGSLHDQLGATP